MLVPPGIDSNSKVILEERGGASSTFSVDDVMLCDEYREFWLTWDVSGGNRLVIGHGSVVNELEIGRHDITQPYGVSALTFANDGETQNMKWDIAEHAGS